MHRMLGSIGAAAAIALCACSQKEAAKADSAPVAQTGAAAASKASYDPVTHVAVVHTKDFAFDAPDSVNAGWTTFHLMNDGPGIHHLQLVRIDSGKTTADVVTAMDAVLARKGPPPAWLTLVAGPNAPNPGAESDAIVNLEPGNYALICLVDIPSHVAHFDKGMVRALKVTAATATPAAEPTADVTIALADYKFDATGPLTTAGMHTFKVTNAGPQPHEIEILRYAPGKTMKDVGDFMTAAMGPNPPAGPPPADLIGGVSAGLPKQVSYFTANLTPGKYVMLCFISDMKDGKPHVEHGMVREFEVK
ncbi:MAG TPA: hypothetical protein VGQ44_22110 [Gemmatimonadaceae bacterium]|nr:hypothetical protein [Gemmatimonadaceae bacterium]